MPLTPSYLIQSLYQKPLVRRQTLEHPKRLLLVPPTRYQQEPHQVVHPLTIPDLREVQRYRLQNQLQRSQALSHRIRVMRVTYPEVHMIWIGPLDIFIYSFVVFRRHIFIIFKESVVIFEIFEQLNLKIKKNIVTFHIFHLCLKDSPFYYNYLNRTGCFLRK